MKMTSLDLMRNSEISNYMKDNNRIAYEFRDTISLRYFMNRLSLNNEEMDFSDLYEDPLFEVASHEHHVYVLTTIGVPIYSLTDHLSDDVEVINEDNVREFLQSLES